MNTYTCPICQESMDRDMMVLKAHTNVHIIDEIKKKHPEWIEENGACQKCVDYYEKAKKAR